MAIRGFIFDMDGVITETSEMHFKAWQALAGSIGITIDKVFNETLKGISRRESLEKILALSDRFFSESEILTMMTQKNDDYVARISNYSRENLNPGIYELMKTIKDNGLKIGVASASKSAGLLIKLMAIEDLIDYIVDPSSVKGKPDPEIFENAATSLGLKPEECIGIEDAEAGIESIIAAGMFAVGVGDKKSLVKSDLYFESTNQLIFGEILKAYEASKNK